MGGGKGRGGGVLRQLQGDGLQRLPLFRFQPGKGGYKPTPEVRAFLRQQFIHERGQFIIPGPLHKHFPFAGPQPCFRYIKCFANQNHGSVTWIAFPGFISCNGISLNT